MKMNKRNTLIRILILGIVVFICSCTNEITRPIPEKHPDLSQGKYDKYLSLLKEAYNTNNNFDAAVQMANLKGDKSSTYQMLKLAIEGETSKCDKVYEWFWMYDRHNFGVNILKFDTTEFKKIVTLCDELNQNISYQVYAKMKDIEAKQAEEDKPKEDSTNFNMALVKQLRQIYDDDQAIRNRITAKNITPELEIELRNEMQIVDSINLEKIDKIFKQFGYPSRELVGKDGNFTPALVIHHSNSLETRYKYLLFLEKAVEDGLLYEGTLNMIKRRIEDMELDQK